MSSPLRLKELEDTNLETKKPRKAAVVCLFYPDFDFSTTLLLILRKTYEGIHSNQVGLPGGKVEKGDTELSYTALRETYEEVGIHPEKINLIRPLTEIYIPPSNFMVQPFLGIMKEIPSFIPQESEVEEIIEVSIADFLNDNAVVTEMINTSYGININIPVYKLNDYTVWGATAMILSEVKELCKSVL